jgi:hypothetical protein
MPDILDTLIAGGCERFVTVSEYMTKIPREEEQRLSTQAPNEGRGEMPPPSLAESVPGSIFGGVLPWLPEDTRNPRMSDAGMRAQPAHPVNARKNANMRTQSTHGGPEVPFAAPETLMTGIVTNGQSTAVRGRIPKLLSDPGMLLPAHKPNRGRQNIKQDESNPG